MAFTKASTVRSRGLPTARPTAPPGPNQRTVTAPFVGSDAKRKRAQSWRRRADRLVAGGPPRSPETKARSTTPCFGAASIRFAVSRSVPASSSRR